MSLRTFPFRAGDIVKIANRKLPYDHYVYLGSTQSLEPYFNSTATTGSMSAYVTYHVIGVLELVNQHVGIIPMTRCVNANDVPVVPVDEPPATLSQLIMLLVEAKRHNEL